MAIRKRDQGGEQRTLVAILLCFGLFVGWQYFFAPPEVPATEVVDTTQGEAPTITPETGGPPQAGTPTAAPEIVPERELAFETTQISATLSSKGGSLRRTILPDHEGALAVTPIYMYLYGLVTGEEFEDGWQPYGGDPGPEIVVHEAGMMLAAGTGTGAREEGDYHLTEGSGEWVATRRTASGITVRKTWRATEDPNVLDVSVEFVNETANRYDGSLWIGSWDQFSGGEGMMSRYTNFGRPFGLVDGDYELLESLEDVDEDGPQSLEGPTGWLGVGDRYFMAVAVPDQQEWGTFSFEAAPGEGTYGAFLSQAGVGLAPGATERVDFMVYVGPRNTDVLKELGHELDLSVDYGFFGFFAKIMLFFLGLIHGVLGNWGPAIILTVLAVKLLFWPLTKKSFESGQAMKALQPELAKLKEKYGDDAQRFGQEQMKLFQENGVNPMSGCLPMLIQMPVWIAMYSALLYSADLYHAEFLYLQDLSVADPYCILPTIVGVMMLVQQRLTPMSPGMDPTQQKLMRLMPFMFVFFYFLFPAGLALYATVNTSLSILQMWLVRRAFGNNEKGPPAATAA